MEKHLTKKQAQAIVDACINWKLSMQEIIDVNSYEWFYEWKDYLKDISFTNTLPVNMSELYDAVDELSLALMDKIIKRELK